jgi:hypothetical protein
VAVVLHVALAGHLVRYTSDVESIEAAGRIRAQEVIGAADPGSGGSSLKARASCGRHVGCVLALGWERNAKAGGVGGRGVGRAAGGRNERAYPEVPETNGRNRVAASRKPRDGRRMVRCRVGASDQCRLIEVE